MNRRKLLIVDDNPDFGGHQVMTAHAVEGMIEFGQWEILALIDLANVKNRVRWQKIATDCPTARLRLDQAATRTRKFQAVRNLWERGRLRALTRQVRAFDPDLVLIVQGNIEQTCGAFALSPQVRCPLVSYIPVPHTHHEMGAKLGHLRDLTCRGLYGMPDGFITISPTLGAMLSDHGARGKIQIVENGIPLEQLTMQPAKEAARRELGLPANGFVWGQIGRIEFKQKGQDFALSAFREWSGRKDDCHLVFLGGGPDEVALKAQAAGLNNVHCLPWTDDPAPFYAAVDGLVLPSRYEGVPLVMLEALARRVPVIATDRDGMRDWLPAQWRFEFRDVTGMCNAMDSVYQAESPVLGSLAERVVAHNGLPTFKRSFNAALEAWV